MTMKKPPKVPTHCSFGGENREVVLSSAVGAMRWRLIEAATRIEEATAALKRGDRPRAMEHLFDLEPLVFDTERVLSALFLLAREMGDRTSADHDRGR